MTIWQIVYIFIFALSLALSFWSVFSHAKEQNKGKPSSYVVGMLIGTFIVYCASFFLGIIVLYLLYQLHAFVWGWLGCIGGC